MEKPFSKIIYKGRTYIVPKGTEKKALKILEDGVENWNKPKEAKKGFVATAVGLNEIL